MEKVLELYKYIDGTNDVAFPSVEKQVITSDFRYDVKRMGGAPMITCTIKHELCLDKLWTDSVYAMFNGERFFIKQVPTSSYDNTDSRYKHEVELVSERIILDNVYFYDVVDAETEQDRPVSNSSKFTFFGDIHEFAHRLNQSLKYSNLGYNVVVDDDVVSESKQVSFQDQFFSVAIQECYNTYQIPYYFVGTTIHIGYSDNEIEKVFKYGNKESLLSIQKNNANYKIVNRVTGVGSSDNIAYYYPNDDSKGVTNVLYNGVAGNAIISNSAKYRKVKLSDKFVFLSDASKSWSLLDGLDYTISLFKNEPSETGLSNYIIDFAYTISLDNSYKTIFNVESSHENNVELYYDLYSIDNDVRVGRFRGENTINLDAGTYDFTTRWAFESEEVIDGSDEEVIRSLIVLYLDVKATVVVEASQQWTLNDSIVKIEDYGLNVLSEPKDGDTIEFELVSYIKPQEFLMPSIYRNSGGYERFYNAINNTYIDPQTGLYYQFDNEYVDGKPKECIVTFDEIKPSIVGITNADGERIDTFLEFAYDLNDNDEFDDEGNYKHPYFFAKLRKFDGAHGFNLFDHAIDESEMSISMTSGSCGSCEFIIGVDSDSQKNLVQVDDYGNLLRDSDGNVRCGREGIPTETPQDKQNDTFNNEVWIALKKDINTFNVIMPNATSNYKPSVKDTFVILHIDLPKAYILSAEKRLEENLIKYMAMNNSEKFQFSISFSRIFFAENPLILEELNENARIKVEYDNSVYDLYVSSYSYSMSNDKPLPEIKVELVDTITVSQNALQTSISEVKRVLLAEIKRSSGGTSSSGDTSSASGSKKYLRKDINDVANGHITFNKGLTSNGNLLANKGATIKGSTITDDVTVNNAIHSKNFASGFTGGKGWAVRMLDYLNSAGVNEKRAVGELDDLIVRGTLRVFEFVISQMLGENDNRTFTSMMEVDHYDPTTGKVWLDTQNGKLYNTFRKDDIILVQQYNGLPSETNEYYITKQYELIIDEVGVGDLSLGEDRLDWVTFRNFSSPLEGADKDIITKGDTFVRIDNLTDSTRKGIMQIMSVGEDTPYMDVIYGKKTDPDNALKSRFGNLQGVYNHLFGWLKDFGAYIANLYAVGEFRIAHTGEDVADKIEMVKGAFRTNFSQTYFDMKDENNYLKNGTFSGEMEGWVLGESGTDFLTVDGSVIYANRNLMTANSKFVGRSVYNDKDMMRILNSDIKQLNSDIKKFGTHKEYVPMDGSEEEPSYEYKDVKDMAYLVIRFYADGYGTIGFGFESDGVQNESFPYTSLEIDKRADMYQLEAEGQWDNEGDFIVRCTGDIYIEFVSLNDKPIENLMTTTQTWIEQDAGRIALLGQKIDMAKNSVTDLGIELDAVNEQLRLYVEKTDENTASLSQLKIDTDGIKTTVASVQNNLSDVESTANTALTNARNALWEAQDAAYDASVAKNNAATALTQSSNAIDILAVNFDDDGNVLATSGIKVYVDNAVSNIKLTADNVDINNGVVVINSYSAKIGGFTVYSNRLENNAYTESSSPAYIFIHSSDSSKVAYIGAPNEAMGYFRNDTGISLRAYSQGTGTALKITAQESSWAIDSVGKMSLTSRYNSSELITVSGLALAYKYGNDLEAPVNPSIPIKTNMWVDFLVLTNNLTLPNPSNCHGKLLFVKCSSSYTLTVPDCVYANGGYTSYAQREFNEDNHMRAFFSAGSRWFELNLTNT